jgi:galactose-1-phosphate uridylyltransferase
MIFKSSLNVSDNYTFHIQITPRINTLAGFELATNMRINPLSPEVVAKKLKEVS